jgi:hypothetical protein
MVRSLPKITSDVHVKNKCKGHPVTCQCRGAEGTVEVWVYPRLTSALDRSEWSMRLPGRLTPRKYNWYPLCRRLGKPQDRSGRLPKISPLLELGPPTVQPTASRYKDYATPALADALAKSLLSSWEKNFKFETLDTTCLWRFHSHTTDKGRTYAASKRLRLSY